MGTFSTSTGERLKKSVIDRKIREAKKAVLEQQLLEYGYNFCVDCKASSGVRIDCSHDISVDECQKSGRAELAFDMNNIKPRCRECHAKKDNNAIQWTS